MYEPVEKTPEKKSQIEANGVSQRQHSNAPTSSFVDNRPEAIQMRRLRELAENSPQNAPLRHLHNLAVANSVAQKKSNEKQGFEFVDNRLEGVVQRKMLGTLNNFAGLKLIQRLPKFKNQNEAITYFEDTIMDNLEEHLQDLLLLKKEAKAKDWLDLLERIDYYTSESKPIIAMQIESMNLSNPDNLEKMRSLLKIVQKNDWDDLEDKILPAFRKLEDTKDGLTATDASGSSVITIDDLPPLIRAENGCSTHEIEMALRGILFGRKYGGYEEGEIKSIAKQVKSAIELYNRVKSVLARGVLKPTDLVRDEIEHTPSSDSTAQHTISMFDIDIDRDSHEERFPYPGHQSIGLVLERRDDYNRIVGVACRAAKAGKALAIDQFEEFRKEFPDKFPTIEAAAPDKIDTMMEIMESQAIMGKKLASLFMAMILRKPHLKGLMESRASKSAMFISSGKKLEDSSFAKEQAKGGAKVQELRIGKSLEPEAISHVLLPEYMRGFVPSLQLFYRGVNFRLVGNTVSTQVGYYNEASRTSTTIDIRVPNYQEPIENLIKSGHRKILTHISNID